MQMGLKLFEMQMVLQEVGYPRLILTQERETQPETDL